jgi:predicted nuclease of predicted toxin-antitoxin system
MPDEILKFNTDENIHPDVAARLRAHGFDAMTAHEQSLRGWTDDAIGKLCRAESRTLLTHDLDFADIRNFNPDHHPGIIILRLDKQDRVNVLNALDRILPRLSVEILQGHIWIVEDDRIRIRSGDP